ncbi:unnamed protein product [Prunus armeniaca]|uniref:Uncharacterized protein n=1 Tax=Prunus armeniaca TaxID=36596 RepID=A0A6J5U1W8_PRUAR|nr:unnamed protein product [Prunus armeniaca]
MLISGSLGSRERIGNIVLGKWIFENGEIFMIVLTKDLGTGSIAFGRVGAHDLNCLYLHRDYSVGVQPVDIACTQANGYCMYPGQWILPIPTWRLPCRCPARIFPSHLPELSTQAVG